MQKVQKNKFNAEALFFPHSACQHDEKEQEPSERDMERHIGGEIQIEKEVGRGMEGVIERES